MPISLKYKWSETLENVIIVVNIKGVKRKTLDFEVTNAYVKVNSPPYFLLLDFKSEICEEESPVPKFKDNHELVFTLKKTEPLLWETLLFDSRDFELKRSRRSAALTKKQERLKKDVQIRRKKKREIEKTLLEESMHAESLKRQKISRLKANERKKIDEEVTAFSNRLRGKRKEEGSIFKGILKSEGDKDIFSDERVVPEVRRQKAVKVQFTPRALRSFAREEKDVEIMKKIEILQRDQGKEKRPLDDPAWMKGRGDHFFKRGAYVSAINAYSHAIDCCKADLRNNERKLLLMKIVANRAAAHLKVGDFSKCIGDCGYFLGIEIAPKSQKDVDLVQTLCIKVLCRRGCAYFKTQRVSLALQDYEKVLQIDDCEGKEEVILDHKTMLEFSGKKEGFKLGDNLRQRGNLKFKYGQYEECCTLYGRHLAKSPKDYIAMANRCAAYLKMNSFAECISNSSSLIEKIQKRHRSEKGISLILLKSYLRRGAAYSKIGDFKRAYNDFERAYRMAPDDKDILGDMEEISKRLQSQVHTEWMKNRANYFYMNGKYQSAIRCYSIGLEKDPTSFVLYANRAQCFMKVEDYVQAVRDVDKALTVVPLESKKAHEKHLKEKMKGDEKKRVSELDKIAVNKGISPKLLLKLYIRRGKAYELMGEVKKSLKDYRLALMLQPNSQWIRDKVKKMD